MADADLKIAGFRLWVHGRQFPESTNEWDGNWLSVTCECEAPGSRVSATGAFVSLIEIRDLAQKLEALKFGAAQTVDVDFMEPELKIAFEVGARGTAELVVELTPDHMRQQHRLRFDIHVSYFAGAVDQCRAILREYPSRGA